MGLCRHLINKRNMFMQMSDNSQLLIRWSIQKKIKKIPNASYFVNAKHASSNEKNSSHKGVKDYLYTGSEKHRREQSRVDNELQVTNIKK